MARASKKKDGPENVTVAPKNPVGRPKKARGLGDNGPTEDDIRIAAAEMIRLNEEKIALTAKISKARKAMGLKGIALGVLDRKLKMLSWTPQEQKAEAIAETFYAVSLGMPAGDLIDLFDEREDGDDPDFEHRKWYNLGRQDGLVGRGWPDEPPAGCPPECHDDYAKGQEDGQAELQASIKRRSNVVALPTAPEYSLDEDGDVPDEPTADEAELDEVGDDTEPTDAE